MKPSTHPLRSSGSPTPRPSRTPAPAIAHQSYFPATATTDQVERLRTNIQQIDFYDDTIKLFSGWYFILEFFNQTNQDESSFNFNTFLPIIKFAVVLIIAKVFFLKLTPDIYQGPLLRKTADALEKKLEVLKQAPLINKSLTVLGLYGITKMTPAKLRKYDSPYYLNYLTHYRTLSLLYLAIMYSYRIYKQNKMEQVHSELKNKLTSEFSSLSLPYSTLMNNYVDIKLVEDGIKISIPSKHIAAFQHNKYKIPASFFMNAVANHLAEELLNAQIIYGETTIRIFMQSSSKIPTTLNMNKLIENLNSLNTENELLLKISRFLNLKQTDIAMYEGELFLIIPPENLANTKIEIDEHFKDLVSLEKSILPIQYEQLSIELPDKLSKELKKIYHSKSHDDRAPVWATAIENIPSYKTFPSLVKTLSVAENNTPPLPEKVKRRTLTVQIPYDEDDIKQAEDIVDFGLYGKYNSHQSNSSISAIQKVENLPSGLKDIYVKISEDISEECLQRFPSNFFTNGNWAKMAKGEKGFTGLIIPPKPKQQLRNSQQIFVKLKNKEDHELIATECIEGPNNTRLFVFNFIKNHSAMKSK